MVDNTYKARRSSIAKEVPFRDRGISRSNKTKGILKLDKKGCIKKTAHMSNGHNSNDELLHFGGSRSANLF